MSAQPKQAPPPAIDFDAAQLVRAHFDLTHLMNWFVLAYPGTRGEYEIQGLADGTSATCTCPGFRARQKCKHAALLVEFLAALERERVGKLPTDELRDNLAWYQRQDRLTVDERRAEGAIRAVLARRGVRLAATPALVAKGRAAVSEIFYEGA